MKRILKKLLRNALGRRRMQSLRELMRTASVHNLPPVLCNPERGKIVVLAPHMDDEVLGCGGTIARHAQAGADVTVIVLTDGRYGSAAIAALPEPERSREQLKLVEIRRQESRRAGEILGVKNVVFLDAEDGRLKADRYVAKKLRAILERERPDCVYLPFFLEGHVDHRAVSDVLVVATAGTGLDFECRGYEVWTPLFPNLVVDIDSTIELKKRALACYASQLADMDYIHTGIGLNAYRSSSIGSRSVRYVEAFHALPLTAYGQLLRSIRRFI